MNSVEKLETPIGEFEYINGYPTDETVEKLYYHLDFQRGIKAYLDFMPAMSMQAIFDCQTNKSGVTDSSTILVYADLLDSAPVVLTGNTESVYSTTQINLKEEGPIVIEAPPMVLGIINDACQRYVTDIGVVGPDKGKGGKYLIVPPGYEGEIPEGYYAARPGTYMVMGDAQRRSEGFREGRTGYEMV